MKNILKWTALVVQPIVAISVIAHAWKADFAHNYIWGGAFFYSASWIISRYLTKRSMGQEGTFFFARIGPSSDKELQLFADALVLITAVLLVTFSVYMPLLVTPLDFGDGAK